MGALEHAPLPSAWRNGTHMAYPFDLPDKRRIRVDTRSAGSGFARSGPGSAGTGRHLSRLRPASETLNHNGGYLCA